MPSRKNLSPRAEAKKLQITRAARRLFLEKGFAGTSMDAVTALAGVSKQTVYSYFSCKDDLFDEVLRNLIDGNAPDGFAEALAETHMESPEDLRRVLTRFAKHLIDHLMNPDYLALIRMTFAELRRFPRLGHRFRERVPEHVMGKIAVLLQKANEKGVASIPDLDAAVRLFAGPLILHVVLDGLLSAESGPKPPSPERITQLVSAFMRAITPMEKQDGTR